MFYERYDTRELLCAMRQRYVARAATFTMLRVERCAQRMRYADQRREMPAHAERQRVEQMCFERALY